MLKYIVKLNSFVWKAILIASFSSFLVACSDDVGTDTVYIEGHSSGTGGDAGDAGAGGGGDGDPVHIPGSGTTDGNVERKDTHYARDITIKGYKAYVADGHKGLLVFSIDSTTGNLTSKIGKFKASVSPSTHDVAISSDGTKAYIADYTSLRVLDVSDLSSRITELGSIVTPGHADGVVLSPDGNTVYVADKTSVTSYNVNNPANITVNSTYSTNTPHNHCYGLDISVDGNTIYAAVSRKGLVALNASDLSEVGVLDTHYAHRVNVYGTTAYVGDGHAGLKIINVSNPSNMSLIGSFNTPDSAFGVAVSGTKAYVADHHNGLVIVNINDPANPTINSTPVAPTTDPHGRRGRTARSYGVAISGGNAYVATAYDGIYKVPLAQ